MEYPCVTPYCAGSASEVGLEMTCAQSQALVLLGPLGGVGVGPGRGSHGRMIPSYEPEASQL